MKYIRMRHVTGHIRIHGRFDRRVCVCVYSVSTIGALWGLQNIELATISNAFHTLNPFQNKSNSPNPAIRLSSTIRVLLWHSCPCHLNIYKCCCWNQQRATILKPAMICLEPYSTRFISISALNWQSRGVRFHPHTYICRLVQVLN